MRLTISPYLVREVDPIHTVSGHVVLVGMAARRRPFGEKLAPSARLADGKVGIYLSNKPDVDVGCIGTKGMPLLR